ncbi:hypothetical protein YSY22_18070 [Brevibacillus formosus]
MAGESETAWGEASLSATVKKTNQSDKKTQAEIDLSFSYSLTDRDAFAHFPKT